MNVSEVLTEVLRITKRPDKSADALIAINKAITYCTLKGDFSQDLVEASLPIDSTIYGDTISITSLARFRRFSYVKPAAVQYYLTQLSPEKIFTPKNNIQPNVYYTSGSNLTYTLSALAASLEVGYLTYPPILDATINNTHWMLDIIPYAIMDLAAAYVFAGIGDDASAKRHETSGLDMFIVMRRDIHAGQ